MTWKNWLIVALVSIIIEILPPPTHFFFLCLAIGAVGASIISFYSTIAWLPWVVFSVVSIALVPVLIPLAKFLFKTRMHPSNVDALIGERALVIESIDPKIPGVVKIHGEKWQAQSTGSHAKDEWVKVIRVEGAHVVVEREALQ